MIEEAKDPPKTITATHAGLTISSVLTTRFRVALAGLSLLILVYYLWSAASNGPSLVTSTNPEEYFKHVYSDEINPLASDHYGYYNLMADSFLAGKLEVLLKPRPELLDLPDPYDPVANGAFRLHDASLYKGRYYLYYGPVPAFILFIPFRILQLGKITEPFAVALFAFGAFLCSALILVQLARRIVPAVSRPLLLLAILSLGISNSVPFLLRRPVVYEVAISAAAFFVMLGLLVLVRDWDNERPSRRAMLLLSLCWGLSLGCRTLFVFAAVPLAVFWVVLLLQDKDRNLKTAASDAVCFAIPFALCVLFLGFYNWLRFDSWVEFGTKYHLAGVSSQPETMFRASNILPGLFSNALGPPLLDYNFPFIHCRTVSPLSLPNNYTTEAIVGFIASSPITIFLCLGWLRLRDSKLRLALGLIAGFGAGVLLFEAFLLPGMSMRYQLDFIFPILVTALLLWLLIDSATAPGWLKNGFRSFSVVLILVGITSHLAFGLTGYYDLFKRSNPRCYFALEDFFKPISQLLAHYSRQNSPEILDPISHAGRDSFYIRMFSPQDATYRLLADFSLHPTAGIPSSALLRVQLGRGIPFETRLLKDTHLEWTMPMRKGVTRIQFFIVPSEPVAGDIDTRYFSSISNVHIFDNVTLQPVK